MKILLAFIVSLASLCFGQRKDLCAKELMCPGTSWITAPEIETLRTDAAPAPPCLRTDGYSSWFHLESTTGGIVNWRMQARIDIHSTQNEEIDWAIYKLVSLKPSFSRIKSVAYCYPEGEALAKGCTKAQDGVYELPTFNALDGSTFALLVKSNSQVSLKITDMNLDQSDSPVWKDCLTDAPTASPTDAPTASPTDAPTASPTDAPTASPTNAPTASPTNAPTWPAHQFVPELVRHDPWYEIYTNAPTAAGPVEYDIPTPPLAVYVPAKQGKTVFPFCVGFGQLCQASYNLY